MGFEGSGFKDLGCRVRRVEVALGLVWLRGKKHIRLKTHA